MIILVVKASRVSAEDVQTSHDADLFGDDEDMIRVLATSWMFSVSLPPVYRDSKEGQRGSDIWEASHSGSRLFAGRGLEWYAIRRSSRHIEEQDILQKKSMSAQLHFNERWEKALREREREKQSSSSTAEEEVAEELAQHEAKISAKKTRDLDTRKNQEVGKND
ncbi:hypothetical protein BDR07DRAFT_1376886 [Suillus spraguei]|nr:hypothetical protein BDR07DRAFT_1376886 [Suillus spraguei]